MDDTHFELQGSDGRGGWKTLSTNRSRSVLKQQADASSERPLRITLETYDEGKRCYVSTVVDQIEGAPARRPPQGRERAPAAAKPKSKEPAPLWKRVLGLDG